MSAATDSLQDVKGDLTQGFSLQKGVLFPQEVELFREGNKPAPDQDQRRMAVLAHEVLILHMRVG
jgi:hypothetical protein